MAESPMPCTKVMFAVEYAGAAHAAADHPVAPQPAVVVPRAVVRLSRRVEHRRRAGAQVVEPAADARIVHLAQVAGVGAALRHAVALHAARAARAGAALPAGALRGLHAGGARQVRGALPLAQHAVVDHRPGIGRHRAAAAAAASARRSAASAS
jgi:hypothetical protein